MNTDLSTEYPQRRCSAESGYPGSRWQCARSASGIRDGHPVCWQHGRAPRVSFAEAPVPTIVFMPDVEQPSSATVLATAVRADIRESIGLLRSRNGLLRELVAIATSPDSEARRVERLEAMVSAAEA